MKNVTIIGHFGGDEIFTDGQTVKTQNLYKELVKQPGWKITKVDTYYNNRNTLKLVIDTIKGIFKSKDIIALVSGNGMKVYFPLLYLCHKLFNKRIYHDVIGGNLPEYVAKYPKYQKYLNGFKMNWVETEKLKKELKECGINNVEVIPNFRRLKPVKCRELNACYSEPYRFCTFSRVTKEKGIEDAIAGIENINRKFEKQICTLDIYGCVDSAYKTSFDKILEKSTDAIKYKGVINSNKSIDTLKKYYCVLFPTHWIGEGSAGTICESFIAGVPVIATDWRFNSEMISDGYNGIIYPGKRATTLESAILWVIDHNGQMIDIKKNCLESAEYYLPQKHIKNIVETLENDND